jgi:hypothetical protein
MPWYEIFGKDEKFEKYYEAKPHLYKTHENDFNKCNDEYLELANKFHPSDYDQWRLSLGKLFEYEKELYAKVDRRDNLIIVSYYDLKHSNIYSSYYDCNLANSLFMRFIFDTSTSEMYHYRMKRFKNITYVLNACDGRYNMGGWTDYDKFYVQNQRSLDDKSIEVLKGLEKFKYLPIEKYKKISVYNLFQVSDDAIYQYEILIKNDLKALANDLLLDRQFISPNNFKRFKTEIMSGIRYKELKQMIYTAEYKEKERIRKLEKKRKIELFAQLPKETYDLGDYILRHPSDYKELEREGRELHHCVAGYLNRIIKGETDVMFLRKKDEPDKPFFTVEIMNNRVTQCRTFKNQTDEKITALVKEWNEKRGKNHD